MIQVTCFLSLIVFELFGTSACGSQGYVCSEESSFTTSQMPCDSIDAYASNSSLLVDNFTLVFLPGTHKLNLNFAITDKSFLQLLAASSDNECQVNLLCTKSVGLIFRNVYSLTLKDICILNCGTTYNINQSYSLVLDSIVNLTLNNVVVTNGMGHGILAKNIYGISSIEYSRFTFNSGSGFYFGGNGLVVFRDCSSNLTDQYPAHLKISHSVFSSGSCTKCNTTYNISVASGLGVILSCTHVHLTLYNVTMENNSNTFTRGFGGNLFIHFFNDTSFTSNSVRINESKFLGGSSARGGGILVVMYTQVENNKTNTGICNNSFVITNTDVSRNEAVTGGGLYIDILDTTTESLCPSLLVVIRNTTFNCNVINVNDTDSVKYGGAAIHINNEYMLDLLYTIKALKISLDNVTVQGSYITNKKYGSNVAAICSMKFLGTLKLCNVNVLSNKMLGISIVKGQPVFKGKVIVKNNEGIVGGGMSLCETSYLMLAKNTSVTFSNNHAEYGGGIYAEEPCLDTHPSCFFQYRYNYFCQKYHYFKNIIDCYGSEIIMFNNTATFGGDDLFGSNVANCSFRRSESYVGYSTFHSIFRVSENVPGHLSSVSSAPVKVCLCDKPQVLNCSVRERIYNSSIYPGQTIKIMLALVGQLEGTVVGIISVNNTLLQPTTQTKSCTEFQFRVNKTNAGLNVTLHFDVSHNDYNVVNKNKHRMSPLRLKVLLKDCPIGFELKNGVCSCVSRILPSFICHIDTQLIERIDYGWIEYKKIYNNKSAPGILYYHELCPFDYCKAFNSVIYSTNTDINTDAQCSIHRSGVLCGACKDNYTLSISSNACLDCKKYSRFLALITIPLYVGLHILIIGILFVMNISITDGTLSGLFFYANIVFTRNVLFQEHQGNILNVVISWLNLSAGFSLCLYDGMDMYAKAWLMFLAPISMWLFVGVLIILSQRYARVASLLGGNAVKVLATVIELSLYKVVQACILTMSFTVMKYPTWSNCSYKYVWLYDANVDYLKGKHIPLFLTGCVFGLTLLLYTLLLLFVQPLMRYSHWRCLRWVNKMKPLIDAYTSHIIKPQCRFWEGLLMTMRIILAIYLSTYLNKKPEYDLLGIAAGCILVIAIAAVFGGAYKSFVLNILNMSFIVNLTFLSVSHSHHLDRSHHCFGCNTKHLGSYSFYPSATIAILTMAGIIIYYVYKRAKKLCSRSNGQYVHLLDVKEDITVYSREK